MINGDYRTSFSFLDIHSKQLSKFQTKWIDAYCCGNLMVHQIKLHLSLHSYSPHSDIHRQYDLLFRVSGYTHWHITNGDIAQCLIIDNTNIDNSITVNLPDLAAISTSPGMAYDYKMDNLFVIGGFRQGKERKIIQKIELNKMSNDFQILDTEMLHPREGCVGAVINHKLLIIGGYDGNKTLNGVELYSDGDGIHNENAAGSIGQKAMNYVRYKPGLYHDKYKQRVYVGGGGHGGYKYQSVKNAVFVDEPRHHGHGWNRRTQYFSYPVRTLTDKVEWPVYDENVSKSVEYFDLNKSEWVLIKNNCKYNHAFAPCLWIDDKNPNILYIGGNDGSNKREQQVIDYAKKYGLGMIEWIDIGGNAQKWSLLFDQDLNKLYKIDDIENRGLFMS